MRRNFLDYVRGPGGGRWIDLPSERAILGSERWIPQYSLNGRGYRRTPGVLVDSEAGAMERDPVGQVTLVGHRVRHDDDRN